MIGGEVIVKLRILRFFRFLRPCPRRLLLFLLFAFISVAGAIQTYAFIDDIAGLEAPPLYYQLMWFDFWIPWILLTAPLCLLAAVLWVSAAYLFDLLIADFPRLGAVSFPVFSVAYSYVAASWLLYCWDRWVSPRPSMRRWMMALPILILLIRPLLSLLGLPMVGDPSIACRPLPGSFVFTGCYLRSYMPVVCPSCCPLKLPVEALLFILSTFIIAYPVLLFYVVSCYGIYRMTAERLSPRYPPGPRRAESSSTAPSRGSWRG
jgi:hypothetical protein